MLISGARLYAFPERPNAADQFTLRDKLELHALGERIATAGFRCVLGRERDGIRHEFIQVHRPAETSVAWTLVRSGPHVRVWHGASGGDLGSYPTLAEAVGALLVASAAPRPAPRRTPALHTPVHTAVHTAVPFRTRAVHTAAPALAAGSEAPAGH